MEGHQTLGFFMTGDGTSTEHKRVMMEKGVDYTMAIINITLQRGECSMDYGAYYMPSLAYGTPATTLAYKKCEDIQRPVVGKILLSSVRPLSNCPKLIPLTISNWLYQEQNHHKKTYPPAAQLHTIRNKVLNQSPRLGLQNL
jgi:hypothetical protein